MFATCLLSGDKGRDPLHLLVVLLLLLKCESPFQHPDLEAVRRLHDPRVNHQSVKESSKDENETRKVDLKERADARAPQKGDRKIKVAGTSCASGSESTAVRRPKAN